MLQTIEIVFETVRWCRHPETVNLLQRLCRMVAGRKQADYSKIYYQFSRQLSCIINRINADMINERLPPDDGDELIML